MRLATLMDGRAVRVEGDLVAPLPGRLVDHLCRAPAGVAGEARPLSSVQLAAPVPRPGKVVCLGLNYADHAEESGQPLPERPLLFAKASTCVIGPGLPIEMPPGEVRLDHEAELAVVIGRPARRLAPEEAGGVIGGYACFNDVSERSAQLTDGQWFRAKSYDTFGPLGPWLVTPDEVGDASGLAIRCLVNDEVRQDSNTSRMAFSVPEIVAYCSHAFTLEPGDVIATGTPSGVGLGTGRWLSPGDRVTVEIEMVGSITNQVVAPPAP